MTRNWMHRTVILADGGFPAHPIPLAVLGSAARVVCCDGAAARLIDHGREPDWIVGDLDGLDARLCERFAARLARDPDQEINDLTKAVRFCLARGWRDLVILGATGLREDHTLGNLSLLADYARDAPETVGITDTGVFVPVLESRRVASHPGQQVSLFSFDPDATVRASGLRWPLEGVRLDRWWRGTLNEALGASVELTFTGGPLLLFLSHADSGRGRIEAASSRAWPDPLPAVLTIAGSDSGGNAGIQADLRAFHAMRVHGCTAITALTAQNPGGVRGVQLTEPDQLALQLDAILECYAVRALKTGMLATAGLIQVVADKLARHPGILKVIDPVMVATSGARLLADDAIADLRGRLLPLATLITPNLPEAEVLLGSRITSETEAAAAARSLARQYGCAVLIKGGHAAARPALDFLCARDPDTSAWGLWSIATPVVDHPRSTHGTGCTLSAAIAAALARGRPLLQAVVEGKALVYEAIRTGRTISAAAAVLGQPERLPLAEVDVAHGVLNEPDFS